jgi:predicted ferric reductase
MLSPRCATTLRDPRPERGAIVTATAPVRDSRTAASALKLARLDPNLVLAVIGAGALAAVVPWWQDTVFVNGLGGWLTNAGRLTGLLAGYAVVVLLALMARLPALERGVGTDRLTRWHAMGGRYTVSLAVAHTLLIIWGYAVSAHTNVLSQTATLITTYPDVLMATVAVLLLVAVGVASARAARRRLRYETWHFIHLYTYLVIALAFSHQFSTGADFKYELRNRVLWSAMYIAVATLLLWYRVLTPVLATLRHRFTVVEVRRESPEVLSVYLTGKNLDDLRAESGQFFRWRFLTRDLWWAANPYSLSAAPRADLLRITVKVDGGHSAALAQLTPGTRVFAEGPYGSFTAARRRNRKVLLIGAGVGITPLRALFESLPGGPGDVTLIYRASTPDDLVLRHELDWIAQQRGTRVHYLVGARKRGNNDHLSAARLQHLVPDLRQHDVYLCGPAGMTMAVQAALRQAKVPRRHIHHESFTF